MTHEELISVKQLATRLGRHENYVRTMKRVGFKMIAGRTTLTAALNWLSRNPQPYRILRQAAVKR